MKQKTSTIAPLHDLLKADMHAARSLGATVSGASESFAAKHGFHAHAVYKYCVTHGIVHAAGEDQDILPLLEKHLKLGGTQLEFARGRGIGKDRVCRLSRQLGWSVQLLSAEEWAMIQDRRAGK